MDIEALKADNQKISDALKVLNQALAKEDKAKKAYNKAKSETSIAKEAYTFVLDEVRKTII